MKAPVRPSRAARRCARHAQASPRPRPAPRWLALGTIAGTAALVAAVPVDAAARATPPGPRVERRLVLDADRLTAALARITVWTPSETIAVQPAAPPVQPAAPVRFDIPPGQLAAALGQFEAATGIAVRLADGLTDRLTTAGVSGTLPPPAALDRLLAGTSLSHRFTSPTAVTIEIRVDGSAVEVSGLAARVASPKYPSAPVETPQTLQVVPRALLDEQGAATLGDALRNVPGITMQAGEGGGASNTSGDMFNMRGFSASNSLFVDGVRDDGLIARDVFNVEQIEVFSGPTGADVGRMNAAGYVNLTTKSPGPLAGRSGSFGYGSNNQLRATVDINQPLALGDDGSFLGSAAIRVNGLWQEGGIAGRDFAERGSLALAPSIAFGLDTPTRVTVAGQIMRQDNLPDYGLPSAASPIGQLTPTAVLAPAPVDQAAYFGSPDVDYDTVTQDSVTARVEHDLRSNLTLRNQTRYNTTAREALVTSIGSAASYDPITNQVAVSRQANQRTNQILSNQTQLSGRVSTGALRHDLSGGVEVASERQDAPGLTGVGSRAPVDVTRPDAFSPVTGLDLVRSGALTTGRTDSIAVYAFDAFDIGDRVRVNGGLRVERYDTSSRAVTSAGETTELGGDGTLVSGKAGLLYRLNPQGTVYVSYGSSLTPPGSANFQLNAGAANQNSPTVDPQASTHYEVGSKWNLRHGRVQLSGAYFYTENTNVIFVIDSTAVPPLFNQDDGQRVSGVTLGAVGRITPRLDLTVQLQYLDTETRSQNPSADRRRLTLAPEVSGNLWATYRLPRNIRIGGGLRHTDAVFINAANSIAIPRYTLADVFAEVPLAQRLVLRLNGYNITDRVYVRNISNNGGRFNPGTPRSFLLSTAIRF